jgi:tetratricopeptide (TPR) repeat protein
MTEASWGKAIKDGQEVLICGCSSDNKEIVMADRQAVRWEEEDAVTAEAQAGVELRQLMNELLGVPTHLRRDTLQEERFRSLALAELLVRESERFEEVSPAKAEDLAELARMIADQPHPVELLPRVDRVLIRSNSLQANVRRLSRDLHGAEVFFEKAMSGLAGPAGAGERGFYCQRLAYLREEQGHREESTALLLYAVDLLREAGAAEAEGACLCRLGFLALGESDTDRARGFFARARGLLSPGWLAARCGLGLALCLAALGKAGAARKLWEHSRLPGGIGGSVPDPRTLLELDWLEGRLAAVLDEHQEAVGRLNSVRRRLFLQRRLLDAALCSLDLARVFVAMERESRIQELVDDLNRTWPVSFEQARMVAALLDYRKTAREGGDLERAAREAMDLIRRPMAILKKL